MVKDLSKDEYSATSAFIQVLPAVMDIRNLDLDEDTKKENAMNLVISCLCKKRNACPNEVNSISQRYITKVRTIMNNKDDIDGIIKYLRNAINVGKNYDGGN